MSQSSEKKLTFQEKLLRFVKKDKKRTSKYSLIGLFISLIVMYGFSLAERPQAKAVTQYKDEVFTASFMGDIMMGRDVKKVTDRKGVDYLFQHVKPYLQNSDYITANLASPITSNENYPKNESKRLHFQANEEAAAALKDMNFTAVNLANTHAMDYGVQGLNDTFTNMQEQGIDVVGAGNYFDDAKQRISYQNFNGITVATLGFTDVYPEGSNVTKYKAGVLPMHPKYFIPMINEAKDKADFVFVNAHWGQEYDAEVHPRQEEFAKSMVDAGADVIIGHHPHVLAPVEVYKDSVIFFSLGNFVHDQGWSRTRESALAQMRLLKDGTARFEMNLIDIREGQPSPVREINNLKKKKMINQLTGDSSNLDWKEENGGISFELDYSDKLKKE
ncbi:CapA family protein [Peribacillus cavernae]|uniref:CapA family protein n=1 Tax=Peribacillus cavernae TaxID=1674310 RepID=A0A3S0U2B0_9BACI|nr:CapA family protein [Peribacillus cavernae]MDQ0220189.1 poly-gamma-glutamate synthesis protein (capsule biosynthesis protein) [Peribacillus cavernae]RUQ28813.1 CapA family protein [Peribacillus cavernae]